MIEIVEACKSGNVRPSHQASMLIPFLVSVSQAMEI